MEVNEGLVFVFMLRTYRSTFDFESNQIVRSSGSFAHVVEAPETIDHCSFFQFPFQY